MAIFRRFKVQQKYVNGQPTEEYRLGVEIDSTDYNSLEECNRGSDCTELEYRWVDMESADDYICEGTNKYKKQMKQQKCVTEEAWTNVYPYEYQKGKLIEHDSVDCGYSPTGEYHIYGTTDGHGSITISPSKEYYSSTDVVTITALPNTDYSFRCYNYGRNLNYGSVTYNSVLSLTMSHNWYVSAEYIDITPYYKIYPSTDGYGTLTFNPSQSSYRKGTEVTIIDKPSINYVFSWFNYGSTIAYGNTSLSTRLKLNMTNDWYVSAVHSYVKPEYEGYLICGYADGTSKSYYWNKSTLSNSDFATILALDGEVTWVMNLDGCVKKINLHGLNFSWISLNGLEICDYANFYNCTSLQDIYLYGSKIVDFKSAKFYKDTERGPFFLYSAPGSLTIHVDCNNYGEYERLYSLVSRPRLILINDTNTYFYPFFIDHITCESVQPIISYTINISEVEGGKTIVVPSKEYYRQYDEVSIYALNSYNYSFKQLNYGENSEYSLSTSSSIINLFITQDWYIKPEFSTSYGENPNGLLYYNYKHNSERWIPWSLPYLTSENTYFDIISCIDYGQTIMKISNMALSPDQYYSEYIGGYVSLPVCREIGSNGINIVALTSLDAKQVEVIQDKGLASCGYLSGLDFPNLVAASYNAFFDTERITFVNMPKLKYCPGFFIGDINYSATLESMTLDNVLYFSGGFYRRTNLATFNAPNCKVFNGDIDTFIHTSIKSLNLPNCCLFSFRYNSQPYEQLTSLVLSDKFFMYDYTIGDYSPLLNISDANIGKFPEGWNNTQLTNNNCNVYGISSSSFATSDVIENLEYINLDNCFYIGSKIFTNAHYISEIILKDCQIVSDQAFGRGASLTKLDLRNAYHIGSSAFCNNPKLSDVNVESVMILGQDAFKSCGMSVLSLPNAVWINNGITECKNLRDIYLNSSIKTTFSSDCFNGCNSNLLIHVPSSQYSRYCIEDGYNYISLYDENILAYNFVLLRNLLTSSTNLPELDKVMYYSYIDKTKSFIKPSISILDSNMYNGQSAYIIDDYYGFITSLSYSAFALHKNLAYINLPSCNSIPESAFYSNKVLKYINVKNAEFIGSSAFANCRKLSNTIILNKCSYIGNNAFYNCSYLTSVCLMSKSIVDFDPSTTFAYCNYTLKIYVPSTLLFYYDRRYGSMSVSLDGGTLYYNRILTTF